MSYIPPVTIGSSSPVMMGADSKTVFILDVWKASSSRDNAKRYLAATVEYRLMMDEIPSLALSLMFGDPIATKLKSRRAPAAGAFEMASISSRQGIAFTDPNELVADAMESAGTANSALACELQMVDIDGFRPTTVFRGVVTKANMVWESQRSYVLVTCHYKAAMLSIQPNSATSAIVNPGFIIDVLGMGGRLESAQAAQPGIKTRTAIPLFRGEVAGDHNDRIPLAALNVPIAERVGRIACAIIDSENDASYKTAAATSKYMGLIGDCIKGKYNLDPTVSAVDPTAKYNETMWQMLEQQLRGGSTLFDAIVAVLTSNIFMLHLMPRINKKGCRNAMEVAPARMWDAGIGSVMTIGADNITAIEANHSPSLQLSSDVFVVRCSSGTSLRVGELSSNTLTPGVYSPDRDIRKALRDAYKNNRNDKVLEIAKKVNIKVLDIGAWQLLAAQDPSAVPKAVQAAASRPGAPMGPNDANSKEQSRLSVASCVDAANKAAEGHYANFYSGRTRLTVSISPVFKFGTQGGTWLEDCIGDRLTIRYGASSKEAFVGRLCGVQYVLDRINETKERYVLYLDSIFPITGVPDADLKSPYTEATRSGSYDNIQ